MYISDLHDEDLEIAIKVKFNNLLTFLLDILLSRNFKFVHPKIY